MTNIDKANLQIFISHLGMFVGEPNKHNIVSFIHGYEFEAKGECDFTGIISKLLTQKYKIKYTSRGWPAQIEMLVERFALDWVTAFQRIAAEVVEN